MIEPVPVFPLNDQPRAGADLMAQKIRSAMVAAQCMREAGVALNQAQERRLLMGSTGLKTGKSLNRAIKALARYERA